MADPNSKFIELLTEAASAAAEFDYEKAEKCYEQAVAIDPESHLVLESLASFWIDIGKFADAHAVLSKAIQSHPQGSYTQYFLLGQIVDGRNSVQAYEMGLNLLMHTKNAIESGQLEGNVDLVVSDGAKALCAVAELFMTDLCMEPDAEAMCGEYLNKANELSPQNYEVLQLLANYKLCQCQPEEALTILEQSIGLWVAQQGREEGDSPSVEFKTDTLKYLIELEQYERAVELASTLLEEEDSIAEIWYLYALAKFHTKEYEEAREAAERCRKILGQIGADDQAKELGEALAELEAEIANNIS
eukprot:GCRY01001785.1.p1 GENE.GCRY01001785.1~~GCRY01001785.1.p1  ORF type:complete len:303 (+),score=85.16 GCRY01001785.1:3-911(+)